MYDVNMPHIHTESGQHDLTSSAYIIRVDGPEPVVLLHEHKKLGIYMQFGGHVELDENPWQAIIREIREETGYTPEQLQVLQPFDRPLTDDPVFMVHPYPLVVMTVPYAGIDDEHFHTDIGYAFVVRDSPQFLPTDGDEIQLTGFTRAQLQQGATIQTVKNVIEISLLALDLYEQSWHTYPVGNWQY